MALANVACVLAESKNNHNILMIDWDLDAPGLHRYFQDYVKNDDEKSLLFEHQLGLIDLFLEIKQICESQKLEDDDISVDFFVTLEIDKYIISTDIDSLFLISAGKLDETYSRRVNSFNWEDFFNTYPTIISKFSEYLSKKYNYVLVDSRTGYTDISGICTTLMPDKLVVVFTPNKQSIAGVLSIAKMSVEYRKASHDLRPLITYPLVSRIEPTEPQLRETWRFGDEYNNIIGYQIQFESLFENIYGLPGCSLTEYFDDIQIQHMPRYSYGEEIAVLAERSEDRLSIAKSYESFTNRLISDKKPWKIPLIGIHKTVFIWYRRTNFYTALAVYQDLSSHGYDAFFDYEGIDDKDFEKIIFENVLYRAHFVIILSPSALENLREPNSIMRRAVELAIDEKRNIIPLLMESFDFDSPSAKEVLTGKLALLRAYNGLKLVPEYIFAGMEKLRRFLNVELEDVRQPVLSAAVEEDTEKRQVKAKEEPVVQEASLTAEEWFERGYKSQKDKKLEEAIRYYKEVLRITQDAITYSNLGVALFDLKRYDEAKEAFRKAIELNPEHEDAYNNLGNLFNQQERYKKAEEAYRKAIELNPKYARAYYNLGILLSDEKLKRYEEAEAIYRKAIELNPKDPADIYYNMGNLMNTLKRYEEAEEAYRKAIEFNPDDPDIYAGLGSLLYILKRNSEGEDVFKKAIELNPNDNYNRACFESLCGNIEEALALLKVSIEKNDTDKTWAKQDPDLENLRADPRFWEIIGEEMPSS